MIGNQLDNHCVTKGDLLCPESLPFAMRKLIYRDAIDEFSGNGGCADALKTVIYWFAEHYKIAIKLNTSEFWHCLCYPYINRY